MNQFICNSRPPMWLMALSVTAILAGCGGSSSPGSSTPADTVAPLVSSTTPVNSATGEAINRKVTATFSEAMNTATITSSTFTLAVSGVPGTTVTGSVSTDSTKKIASFTPAGNLTVSTAYTATITTGVKDLAGNAMAATKSWSFTTGTTTDSTLPTVSTVTPLNAASGVAISSNLSANFSEPMDATTISDTSFILAVSGVPATHIAGAVTYTGTTATFNPTSSLVASTIYVATVKNTVKDLANNAMLADYAWSFTTGTAPVSGVLPVDLGTAGNYVVLSKTGVSTTGATSMTGNIGVSPAARTYLTGWALISEPTDTFYTSTYSVAGAGIGKLYASDMVGGTTSSDLTTAIANMETAYTYAAGMAPAGGALAGGVPGAACPGSGGFGGVTFAAGVYTCAVNVGIDSNMTLNGSATDVWVFQITGKLTQASATQVQLTGGALAKNVFWQVAGDVDIGTTALMQGVILGKTLINLNTGATENGRLLSQTAVTLHANAVTQPAP